MDGREKRRRDDDEAEARRRKKEAKRAKKEAKRAKKGGGGGGDEDGGDARRDEDVRADDADETNAERGRFSKGRRHLIANACAKTKDLELYTTFEEARALGISANAALKAGT